MRCFMLLCALPLLTVSYCLVWNYAAVCGERYHHHYSGTPRIVSRLQAAQPVVQFLVGIGDFSVLQKPRPALGPIHPSVQWVPALHSRGIKWMGHEVDWPLLNAQVKAEWSYTSAPVFHRGVDRASVCTAWHDHTWNTLVLFLFSWFTLELYFSGFYT
jgi:hypothetical protein